jgi:hypothetical protein
MRTKVGANHANQTRQCVATQFDNDQAFEGRHVGRLVNLRYGRIVGPFVRRQNPLTKAQLPKSQLSPA